MSLDGPAECQTCRFWRRVWGGEPQGECRRYPPVVILSGQGRLSTEWPVTEHRDWCGAFERKGD